MGGYVATTIKGKEGKVTKTITYTGDVNDFFFNEKFHQDGGDSAVTEFVAQTEAIKNDYIKNKDTENFESDYAEEYGSYDSLAPKGYGLIVIDFEKKIIASMQGYHHPGNEHIFSLDRIDPIISHMIRNDLLDVVYWDKSNTKQSSSIKDFFGTTDLKEVHAMYRSIYFKDKNDTQYKKLGGIVDIDKIELDGRFLLTPIHRHGFSEVRFEEDEEGYLNFYKHLQDAGFEISNEDTELWADHFFAKDHFYLHEVFKNRKGNEEYQAILDKFKALKPKPPAP